MKEVQETKDEINEFKNDIKESKKEWADKIQDIKDNNGPKRGRVSANQYKAMSSKYKIRGKAVDKADCLRCIQKKICTIHPE